MKTQFVSHPLLKKEIITICQILYITDIQALFQMYLFFETHATLSEITVNAGLLAACLHPNSNTFISQ